jgi:trk system potassium uptake protein TrkA
MKIIIVGCGRIGADLAQTLERNQHAVTVIDKDPEAFVRLGPTYGGQTITGVGFDRDVLLAAEIEHTDGLAAVTNSDEANVVTAQVAHHIFHVPRVVARLYDPRQAEIYNRLGLYTVAPNQWGVQQIAEMLAYSQMDVITSLGSKADIVEIDIPTLLIGRTVNDLTIPGDVTVIAINRHNSTMLPTLGTVFQSGDKVFLAVMHSAAARLNSMLAPE